MAIFLFFLLFIGIMHVYYTYIIFILLFFWIMFVLFVLKLDDMTWMSTTATRLLLFYFIYTQAIERYLSIIRTASTMARTSSLTHQITCAVYNKSVYKIKTLIIKKKERKRWVIFLYFGNFNWVIWRLLKIHKVHCTREHLMENRKE